MEESYSCPPNLEKLKIKDQYELIELVEKLRREFKLVLIILPSEGEIFDLLRYMNEKNMNPFPIPAHDNLPFDLKPSSYNVRQLRIRSLFKILIGGTGVFLASLRGILCRILDPQKFLRYSIRLKRGGRFPEKYFETLGMLGYRRVNTVRFGGEYARRGCIVDVFSPYHDEPIRIELFDDEIVDIRLFKPSDQRSFKRIDETWILPVHDYIMDGESVEHFEGEIENLKLRFTENVDFIDDLQKNVDSLDSLVGIFEKRRNTVLDLFDRDDSFLVFVNLEKCERNYRNYVEELFKIYPGKIFRYMYSRYSSVDLNRLFYSNVRKLIVDEFHTWGKDHRIHSGGWFHSEEVWFEEDLKPGDFVVHVDYGIGIFKGIVEIENYTGKRDYIEIMYRNGVKLYVPVEKIHRIHKYVGPTDGLKPSDISGGEWAKLKKRVRKDIEKKVDDLLKLYALRMKSRKRPMKGDMELEEQFALSFPYMETPAQLKVLDEILKDMEREVPMDRLLCGDSGVGKTEVAMRSALRAIASGKQVAFLVPTVVLARQHYENYKKRFDEIGVRIELFDRSRTKGEKMRILEDLKAGRIDMIIGTHGILSDDLRFKDLGLLIIDEEQRFGVFQKEKLKRLRVSVDVLSISATPIPRTLYMAVSGIKGMSIMDGNVGKSVNVEVIVTPFDDRLIKKAILVETSRGGQVLYIHNRIGELEGIRDGLRKEFEDLRIEIAHGKLQRRILKEIISALYDGKIDVLITTTIFESGIDIQNLNTIIVDDAHRYGISELYQLRGRVGRGQRKGYAYFMYPPDKLTEEAKMRLKAIESKSNLSGLEMAMLDMEMRGIGNVLGLEQHGNMRAIGYRMFMEILEDVFRRRIGEFDELEERSIEEMYLPRIDGLKLDAKIPADYVPDVIERINLYRRISGVERIEELGEIEDEMVDRFGKIPEETRNLLNLMKLRLILSKHGIRKIEIRDGFRDLKISGDTILVSRRENILEFMLNSLKEG